MTEEEDNDVLGGFLSSAAAAEGGGHREDSGLEEKSMQAYFAVLSLIASELSAFLSPHEAPRHLPLSGPQWECIWESFLLKSASAAARQRQFLVFAKMKFGAVFGIII